MSSNRPVVGKIFSSSQFKYDADKRLFTSSLSETPEILRQLWADSLDLGFGIKSHKTGRVVFFTLDSIERKGEKYISWTFKVYNPTNGNSLSGLSVCVFNVKE